MQINVFPFLPATEIVQITVYTNRAEKAKTAFVNATDCPLLWEDTPELAEIKQLYFPINKDEDCYGETYTAEVNLNKSIAFAKHYFRKLIHNHFKTHASAVGIDYVGNIEVWTKATQQPYAPKATQFQRFSLIPQYQNITESWELTVSYNGNSVAYNTPISQYTPAATSYRVIATHQVVNHKYLSPEQKQDIQHIYPILNPPLFEELNITENRTRTPNKYIDTLSKIKDFVNENLFSDNFSAILNITLQDFLTVPEANIQKADNYSNQLLFGNNQSFNTPAEMHNFGDGMKKFGPYKPSQKNEVRFLYIYQKSDQEICKQVIAAFKKHYSFSLSEYIKQQFSPNEKGLIDAIAFENIETAYTDIRKEIATKDLNTDTITYLAIYISPISRDNVNSPYHSLYYQIKELLLTKNITSQVIYREKPNNQYFGFFLPNIAVAILAKLGGIPWALPARANDGDLIVGVGAFKSQKIGERYIGSAFCFDSNGVFQNCDCYKDNDLNSLVAGISKAIGHFVVNRQTQQKKELKRLVIHYYKTMSNREAEPITKLLHTLNYTIPIVVVTINKTESQDFVAFNPDAQDLMPISGTFVKVRKNQYLIYNSAKYNEQYSSEKGWKDYLFPIKATITRADKDEEGNKILIQDHEAKEMLDITYQFSRMYWKSIKQQNMPITIKYPEMVAQIVPFFKEKELPPFGKSNLWFL